MAVAREARGVGGVPALAARLGWPRIAPGLVSFALIASTGLADGGVFPRSWRLGAFALFAVGAAALLGRERVVVSPLGWFALAALAAFTGWIALSAAWSGKPSASLLEAERGLLYVAAVLAVLVLAERATVAHLLVGSLAGITLASGYGLAIYLFASPPPDPFEGSLLYQPLGYANALGIFVGIGVLLAIGLAPLARHPAARAAALAPLLILVPSLLLTSSRGAWVALVPGFGALALLRGGPVRGRAVALVGVVAAVVAAIVVVASRDVGRLVTENRLRYWEVAWDDYREHPLLGSGAGTFGDYWLAHVSSNPFTRTAHSLYLQSLAELGPVGLLLVVAAIVCPLVVLRRRRDPLVAVAAAGYTAFVVHAGIDWDWELPAVTLAGLFCGAALLVATRPEGAPSLGRPARLALALGALALAVFAIERLRSGGGFFDY